MPEMTMIIQGGAFALLAFLTVWATKQVPELFRRHDALVITFQRELKEERDICERRYEKLISSHKDIIALGISNHKEIMELVTRSR